MKKSNIIKSALFLPLLLLFSSCFDPVFYEIRKDVPPESATVSGNIGQLTRFTMDGEEYLFASADDGLRYKKASDENHGSWSTMELPFSLLSFDFSTTSMKGYQIIGILANSDTLYLIAAQYQTSGSEGCTDPKTIELWGKQNNGEWVNITKDSTINYFTFTKDSSTELYSSNFNYFQTNTPQKQHRHAYLCSYITNSDNSSSEYKYFELIGTNQPTPVTITKREDTSAKLSSSSRAYSAAYFEESVKFFASKVVITDETATSAAKNLYYSDGDALYYYSSEGYKKACSAGTTISAMAVTKNSILLGLGNIMNTSSDNGGIKRVLLASNGIPESYTSDFETNANFQISTAYIVLTLLNATPEKKETDCSLYASITFSSTSGLYDNIGLWSYYPGRGNWNRE